MYYILNSFAYIYILLTFVEISKSGFAPSNNLIIAVFPFSTAIYNAVFRSYSLNNLSIFVFYLNKLIKHKGLKII